ncbi:hypothetical protein HDU76_000026 [Blyttiomyces sp. JEL0837]|nr:hypothetical protein HDU76_000026 [Blyttiomyces sp. JEL0837]
MVNPVLAAAALLTVMSMVPSTTAQTVTFPPGLPNTPACHDSYSTFITATTDCTTKSATPLQCLCSNDYYNHYTALINNCSDGTADYTADLNKYLANCKQIGITFPPVNSGTSTASTGSTSTSGSVSTSTADSNTSTPVSGNTSTAGTGSVSETSTQPSGENTTTDAGNPTTAVAGGDSTAATTQPTITTPGSYPGGSGNGNGGYSVPPPPKSTTTTAGYTPDCTDVVPTTYTAKNTVPSYTPKNTTTTANILYSGAVGSAVSSVVVFASAFVAVGALFI